MGLALSLRRLDLIEMIFLTSRASPQASSSTGPSKNVAHDEGLLRYVLAEVVSGTSGNENWPPEFRERVSINITHRADLLERGPLIKYSCSPSFSASYISTPPPTGTLSPPSGCNPATGSRVPRLSPSW
jgi:26S proteasome regulatory subunit N2